VNYIGFEVLTVVAMKSYNSWDVKLCSPLTASRRFGGHVASETSVDFQRTTRHFIPEDRLLQTELLPAEVHMNIPWPLICVGDKA
jgi:hypothetical protein